MDSPPGYSIWFPDDGEHPAVQSHDAGQSNFGWAMSVATGNDDFARLAKAIERCQKDAKAQNVEAEKILDLINLRSAIFQPPKFKTKASMSQDAAATVPKIKTKSVFSFMDLPAELRVKICEYILISVSDIAIPHKRAPKSKQETPTYPSVAILRACKLLNEEATPILYGKNNFAITLPDPSSRFDESFPLFSSLRWTSIELIPRLSFTSFTNPGDKISPASFVCTGADILTQFKPGDFRLSPVGMDRYHVRHAWNWISCEVMKAELAAFQKEWKELMEPAGFELPPMDWDPQSLFGLQEFGYL